MRPTPYVQSSAKCDISQNVLQESKAIAGLITAEERDFSVAKPVLVVFWINPVPGGDRISRQMRGNMMLRIDEDADRPLL